MTTTSPVIAGAPGDCCFTGFKHTGEPGGKEITIASVPTYISEPSVSPPKGIVLFLADVWGPMFLNNKLLQDFYASHGFLVLGIDYFFGDPVQIHTEADFDRNAWMAKSKKQAHEAFPRWLKAVRNTYGSDTKYCAVGYCFGGPFALNLAMTQNVVASAFAHPAFLNEDHFTQITKPLFLSCAETDHTFPLESRRRAEDLLLSVKATYTIQVFSGVSHGFSARGNPDVDDDRWAKEESAGGIVRWFERFIVQRTK